MKGENFWQSIWSATVMLLLVSISIRLDATQADTKACHDFVRALSVAVKKERTP